MIEKKFDKIYDKKKLILSFVTVRFLRKVRKIMFGYGWKGKLKNFEINKIYMSSCKTEMVFVDSEDNQAVFEVEADCCSESWIEHISIGWTRDKIVESIEENEMEGLIGTKQEVDMVYSTVFKNKEGEPIVSVEYRNSSNGYYGGWLERKEGKVKLEDYGLVTREW